VGVLAKVTVGRDGTRTNEPEPDDVEGNGGDEALAGVEVKGQFMFLGKEAHEVGE
jgi:hypothetical protein